jgi:Putative peptidoglycan binding domain
LNNHKQANVEARRREDLMKLFLSLSCCFAVALTALAEPQDNQHKKKNAAQPSPQTQQAFRSKSRRPNNVSQFQNQQNASRATWHNVPAVQSNTQAFRSRSLNLANRPNLSIPSAKFRAGARIEGSENWKGARYAAFRAYHPEWHDRAWWRDHHTRIVFVFGGWYFWNAGYWCPAWGYDPSAFYAYDGPIYASSPAVDPGQVVANVQSALQDQGYYDGDIDGVLGPLTRAAIARYQQDNGLYITSAIDEPTLESLGLA